MNRKNAQGLTLIELMVVVAIIGILAALGLPAMGYMVASAKVNSAANDILLLMQRARSEAIKNVKTVQVCPTANGTACLNSTSWSTGGLAKYTQPGAAVIVDVKQLTASQLDITGPASVSFTSIGSSASKSTITIAAANGTTKSVCIDVSGRSSITKASTCP